jgi:hypothetical protein
VQLEAGTKYAALEHKTLVRSRIQLAFEPSRKQNAPFGVHAAFVYPEYGFHVVCAVAVSKVPRLSHKHPLSPTIVNNFLIFVLNRSFTAI